MYPCQNCLENSWKLRTERDLCEGIITKWVKATCNVCGSEVEFGHKSKKVGKQSKAEYKIKDGKRFLKIGRKYVEVELKQINKKGNLRVMPV